MIFGLKWHENSHELGFNLSTCQPTVRRVFAGYNFGQTRTLDFQRDRGLNAANFAQPQLIHWKSWDARSISGFLFKPPSKFSGKRPVIINIHGGPEGQSRPEYNDRDNYFISELGIAIIYPNVRGSTGYGKSFQKLDNGFLREGSYQDINTLLDWIQTQPDLDCQPGA